MKGTMLEVIIVLFFLNGFTLTAEGQSLALSPEEMSSIKAGTTISGYECKSGPCGGFVVINLETGRPDGCNTNCQGTCYMCAGSPTGGNYCACNPQEECIIGGTFPCGTRINYPCNEYSAPCTCDTSGPGTPTQTQCRLSKCAT